MVSKKSFKLLVAYDTTSFFVVVPIISVKGCRKCYFPANFAVCPLIFDLDCTDFHFDKNTPSFYKQQVYR